MKQSPRGDRMMRDFGTRLRASRITSGYESAQVFASDLAIDAQRYRKYERGESIPPLEVLEQIVKLTGKSLDWLLLGNRPAS